MPEQDPHLLQPIPPGLDRLKILLQEKLQNGWEAFTKTPDPTIGGMGMMIPSVGNLPRFAGAMKDVLEEMPKELPPGVANSFHAGLDALKNRFVQAYMQVRYPRQMAIPSELSFVAEDASRPELAGLYKPATRDIAITAGKSPASTANTIGHEMTHAKDFADRMRPGNAKEVASYMPYDKYSYMSSPYESRAGQAGATAQRGLEKFIQLINPSYKAPPPYVNDSQTFNSLMNDMLTRTFK